jgi:hypothetical protein
MPKIEEVTPQLVDTARAELEWLRAAGWVESRSRVMSSSFLLELASTVGTVTVSADLARRELDVYLAPLDVPRSIRAGLRSLLKVHGLPELPSGLDVSSVDAAKESVRRAVRALELLRDAELAGDWSRFDDARAQAGADREAAIDGMLQATADPKLRAALERRRDT